MNGVERADSEMFTRLASVQQAMKNSALDSVLILDHGKKVFYSNYGDSVKARGVMNARVRHYCEDIEEHYRFHLDTNNFFSFFKKIDWGFSRGFADNAATHITKEIRKYADVVAMHRSRLGRHAFLNYPSLKPGYYMPNCSKMGGKIVKLSFNPEHSYRGMIEEADGLDEVLEEFRSLDGEFLIDDFSVSSTKSTPISLRDRVELDRVLLMGAGLDMDRMPALLA